MKFDCIMLAAGLSSRMSQWKLLREYCGKSIIQQSLENASEYCGRIIISGGYRINELRNHLEESETIRIIENPDYREGMMTSIKAALPYVETDSFFITLGDMPLISSDIYRIMSVHNFNNVLFPLYKGKRGHPVLVKSLLSDDILKSDVTGKMKDLLNKYETSELEVNEPGILQDIDTDSDYNNLLRNKISL